VHYKNLNINTWDELDKTGDIVTGYYGIFLNQAEGEKSDLLIFKDENENLHFVIADDSINKKDILDPKVNGLKIELKKYKLQDIGIKQFIDLECSLKAYISEFTEVVREISEKVLIGKELSVISVMEIINNWKSFWASRIKQILSEEEQIGLICELKVLNKLCEINLANALNSWKGPLNEKYDFIFSDWVFEVKGARKEGHIHTINGLDQLKPPSGKRLALISFLATKSGGAEAESLQDRLEDIENKSFKNKPDIIEQFYKLLTGCGYSRIYKEEYRKSKFDIYDGKFFTVNEDFPKLTPDQLTKPLDSRISEIRYTIDLEGLSGETFENLPLGKYFY
jgi:hypothetical protein